MALNTIDSTTCCCSGGAWLTSAPTNSISDRIHGIASSCCAWKNLAVPSRSSSVDTARRDIGGTAGACSISLMVVGMPFGPVTTWCSASCGCWNGNGTNDGVKVVTLPPEYAASMFLPQSFCVVANWSRGRCGQPQNLQKHTVLSTWRDRKACEYRAARGAHNQQGFGVATVL